MDSLRVLHCANFSELKFGAAFYAMDRKISNGLIRNGHFVYDFSYRDMAKCLTIFKTKKMGVKKVNDALFKTVKNIEPDLLLLGHSELITRETLLKIKEKFPRMKIAMWWVDPFNRIEHINERIDLLDAFFSSCGKKYVDNIFDTYKDITHHLPNICDKSIENFKAFNNSNFNYDLIYVGRRDKKRNDFLDKISNIKNIKVKFYGDSKQNLIFGYEYFKKLSSSKIALNYSRDNNIDMGSSDRIIHLTANGIFTLTPKIPNFTKLFKEDEICYFDDFDDFEEKVYYYLKNENQRREIAKKGWIRAHKSFNAQRVSKYMLETIFDMKYSEKYEWI